MPTKTGQAGSLTESTNLESTNLAKPTGMKTLDSSRPNQKKVAVRPLRSFEKENTVSSDASLEGRLAIYSQSERKLPSVNSLGRSHKPNSSTEATDTMSSSKPSRSNFLARLTTPTQASRNRMRETLKNTSQRTVSSPISSTSSNFPKFSSERKSPPRGSRSSPTVQSISSNHTRGITVSSQSPRSASESSITTKTSNSPKSSRSFLSSPSRTKPASPSSNEIHISRPFPIRNQGNLFAKGNVHNVSRRAPASPQNKKGVTGLKESGLMTPRSTAKTSTMTPSPSKVLSPSSPIASTGGHKLGHGRRQSAPAPSLSVDPRRMSEETKNLEARPSKTSEQSKPDSLKSPTSSVRSLEPSQLREHNESLRTRNAHLRTRLNEVFDELDQTNIELAVTKASRDTLQQQVSGFKLSYIRAEKENLRYQKEFEKAQKLISLLSANIQELKTSLEEKHLENLQQARIIRNQQASSSTLPFKQHFSLTSTDPDLHCDTGSLTPEALYNEQNDLKSNTTSFQGSNDRSRVPPTPPDDTPLMTVI